MYQQCLLRVASLDVRFREGHTFSHWDLGAAGKGICIGCWAFLANFTAGPRATFHGDCKRLGCSVQRRGWMDGGFWRFILLFCKADEKTRADDWGLRHYNDAGENCPHCRCDRAARPWTDLRVGALWRNSCEMSRDEFVNRCRRPFHPIVASRFTWKYFFYVDAMHVLDCRGVASVVYGSLIDTVINLPSCGRSQEERLRRVNLFLKEFYDENTGSCRLPWIKLSNVHLEAWSELHGPAIKAANSRQAAPAMAALARELLEPGDEEGGMVIEITSKLEEMYYCLAEAGMFFDAAALDHFTNVVLDFGLLQMRLRAFSAAHGKFRWQVKPKSHKCAHLPEFAGCINPRMVSCYADESHIGTCCLAWKRSLSGRWAGHVQRSVLLKRWVGVLVRMELPE